MKIEEYRELVGDVRLGDDWGQAVRRMEAREIYRPVFIHGGLQWGEVPHLHIEKGIDHVHQTSQGPE